MSTRERELCDALDIAAKLEDLAEERKFAPEDYYGSTFWTQDDIQLLRDAAAELRMLRRAR